MSHPIDPSILRVARAVARRYARRAGLQFDDCIGCAYLAVAELAAKRELRKGDAPLVVLMVKRRIIDWQRSWSPLTRRQIDRRVQKPQHVELEEETVGVDDLPISDFFVRRAIMRLERRLRDIVIAYYFAGVTEREIGEQIDRTESRANQLLREAKERLREMLRDDFSQ